MTVLRDRFRASKPAAHQLNFKERFVFGRTTASDTCQGLQTQKLPNAETGCPEVRRVFMDNLGLDEHGAAALMGVHTIGRARVENSGYSGFWSDPENSRMFNNNYYVSMLVKGWLPVEISPGKHQWNRADRGIQALGASAHEEMMLNTDLCLTYVENGQELNAFEHDDCCAWVDSFVVGGKSNGAHDKAVKNNNGLFCGVNCATDPELNAGSPGNGCNGGLDERRMCCGAQADNDCGNPGRLAGLAFEAVEEFAIDDNHWLDAFQDAWADVTELGVHDLEHLRAFCPEDLNLQQNHT